MHRTEQSVDCTISIFEGQENEVRRITEAINATKDIAEKEHYAKMMLEELGILLSCRARNEKDENCVMCHRISSLRKTAADVVLKGIQLARKLKG
jgi:hypothetical protein